MALPHPPNPNAPAYSQNPGKWEDDAYAWMSRVKQQVDALNRSNSTAAGIPITVSSFTTNTSLSGTMTGTDAANAICTIAQSLIKGGIILGPSAKRTQ